MYLKKVEINILVMSYKIKNCNYDIRAKINCLKKLAKIIAVAIMITAILIFINTAYAQVEYNVNLKNDKILKIDSLHVEERENQRNVEYVDPLKAFLIIDVSGSIKYYEKDKFSQNPIDYIISQITDRWVVKINKKNNNEINFFNIDKIFLLGKNLKQIKKTNINLLEEINRDRDFSSFSSLTIAADEFNKSLKTKKIQNNFLSSDYSLGIFITDFESDSIEKENCRSFNSPSCFSNSLKELYNRNANNTFQNHIVPGMWILKIDLPYSYKKNRFNRPIFIFIMGYYINGINDLIAEIVKDISKRYNSEDISKSIKVIQICPGQNYDYIFNQEWKLSGIVKISNINKQPMKWIESYSRFKCNKENVGDIEIIINEPNFIINDIISSPYELIYELRMHNSENTQFFNTTVPKYDKQNKIITSGIEIACHRIMNKKIVKNESVKLKLNFIIRNVKYLNNIEWIKTISDVNPKNTFEPTITYFEDLVTFLILITEKSIENAKSNDIVIEFGE